MGVFEPIEVIAFEKSFTEQRFERFERDAVQIERSERVDDMRSAKRESVMWHSCASCQEYRIATTDARRSADIGSKRCRKKVIEEVRWRIKLDDSMGKGTD